MKWITRESVFDIPEGAICSILCKDATVFGVHQASYELGSGDFIP